MPLEGERREQILHELEESFKNKSETPQHVSEALHEDPSLLQDLSSTNFTSTELDGFLESVCLAPSLRGSQVRSFALGILAERIEGGVANSQRLGDVLGELLLEARASGLGGGIAKTEDSEEQCWQTCANTLRLAALGLQRQGLEMVGGAGPQGLQRLQALLKLAAGEVRLGLENHLPLESLCAGVMFAEVATTALTDAASTLEDAGSLQNSAECLRVLHRILGDAYDFCLDLPEHEDVPKALPLVARLIGVWQLEDPMRFATEFQRSLPVLCRLQPLEFEVLLPSILELQDWHLTPALAKCLELFAFAVGNGNANEESGAETNVDRHRRHLLVQPCALGLAEVTLDAAAYLPEAPVPEAPALKKSSGNDAVKKWSGAFAAHLQTSQAEIPRPPVASDAKHAGVQRLCAWSSWLWKHGRAAAHLTEADRSLLALVCASLLTSVPEAALLEMSPGSDMWTILARFALASDTQDDIIAAQRLALRFCGFSLAQHSGLSYALVKESSLLRSRGLPWLPQALASEDDDDEADEWKVVDDAATKRIRGFLKAAVPVFTDTDDSVCAGTAVGGHAEQVCDTLVGESFESMD